MSEQRLRNRDQDLTVDITREGGAILVRRGDEPQRRFEARRIGTAEFVVSEAADGDRMHAVYALRDGDNLWIHVDGRTWLFERVSARGTGKARPGGLSAPIPATVQEVLVADGDTVEEGQVLLVLTAMKMQLEITAPGAGMVGGLQLSPGDQVEAGRVLLRVVAADAGAGPEDC